MSNISFDFCNENFVVTGASSGMGRQVVRELAEAGAMVLAIGRNAERLAAVKQENTSHIVTAEIDVCDSDAIEKAISNFVATYGKLNGIVHAAGITGLTPLRAFDEIEARKIMDISFWAGAKLIQISTKRKFCNDEASVVWFSSERARAAASAMFAYSGAKLAVQVAARTFAKELAKRKIRVNTVSPGWVKTNMTNNLGDTHNMSEIIADCLFGFGEPKDVSGMVLFLLSDRAKWITGADMVVSGGFAI